MLPRQPSPSKQDALKAALTVRDGRISPVFDVCRQALVLESEGGHVVTRSLVALDHADALDKVRHLVRLGVTTLVCGAVSQRVSAELDACRMRVFAFVAGEAGEVIQALLSGALPSESLAMPGCAGRNVTSDKLTRSVRD